MRFYSHWVSRTSNFEPKISFHDSTQVEIKVSHHIPSDLNDGDSIQIIQKLYFYIPKVFGINKNTYGSDQFYRSLTNYLRIKTPQFLTEEELAQGRVDVLMPTLAHSYLSREGIKNYDEAANEVRVFGAYCNDQFKHFNELQVLERIQTQIQQVHELILAYRKIMDDILLRTNGKEESEPLRLAFLYIDEFVSNRLEESIASYIEKGIVISDSIASEFQRRKKMGYLQIYLEDGTEVQDEQVKEGFTYRMGKLKKYASELLYLEMVRVKKDKFYVHFAAAVGAGMVALANALLNPMMKTSVHVLDGVATSIPLMVTVVIGFYIFQDRFKDVLRDVMLKYFKPWLPDYDLEINYQGAGTFGHSQEEFTFSSPKEIPQSVENVRRFKSERIPFVDSSETILCYTRRLNLKKKVINDVFKNVDSMKDIMRFDFNAFLAKLGNPIRLESFVLPDHSVKRLKLPKVYHINLVMTYEFKTNMVSEPAVYYTRARVVLDKSGIKRVEMIDASSVETNYVKPGFMDRSIAVLSEMNPFI